MSNILTIAKKNLAEAVEQFQRLDEELQVAKHRFEFSVKSDCEVCAETGDDLHNCLAWNMCVDERTLILAHAKQMRDIAFENLQNCLKWMDEAEKSCDALSLTNAKLQSLQKL